MKPMRVAHGTIAIGAVSAISGLVTSVIYLFQPWRTCSYDDTPAACAMLPADAAVLAIAVVATLVGVGVAATGALVRRDIESRERGGETRSTAA